MDVYVIGSSLTLDDLCQLQSLLSHEHRKREKYAVDHHRLHSHPVHHHHELQFRHAMTPAVAQREQERLQVALEHLKVLKEQYRRQRALQIQVYLDNFRRQQLIRAALEEEEERYYRQCISAALEKRRVNSIFNQYLLQHQFQQQKLEEEKFGERLLQNEGISEHASAPSKSNQDEDDEGYSEYHSQQLSELLKQIFNHQPVFDNDENDTEREMADVWQYVLDAPGDKRPSYQFDVPMTERGTPSPVPHLVTQDPVTAYINQRERAYDDANQDSEKLQQSAKEDDIIQRDDEEEKEGKIQSDKTAIKKANEDDVYLKKLQSEQQHEQQTKHKENKIPETDETSEQSDTDSLPPLQDHILTLQDLINKLSSEPVMVGEQYAAPEPVKKDVPYLDVQPSDKQIPEYSNSQSDLETRDENESPVTFMPQSIITSAEPTPTIEQSGTDVDEKISDFVDSIAAEQKQDLSSGSDNYNMFNPRKSAKPKAPVQSKRDEANLLETDNVQSQDKSKASDHANVPQITLTNQQPLQQQSENVPIIDPIALSVEPDHPNSIENIPTEGSYQRIPANSNIAHTLERDPAKQHIYNQLDQIESKINNPGLKSRLDKVLHSKLSFSKEGGGTLLLSASTQADREFLGLEDELMRIMLELDNIISEGDEGIRDYRRTLVKRCESMLDKLDQHKQKEWEKTIGTKHRRDHSHKL
jgi:hypothetical protein